MSTGSPNQLPARHWFTTTWLILALIVNAGLAMLALNPNLSIVTAAYTRYIFALLYAGAALGDIALLLWKKWGFFLVVGCIILNLAATVFLGSADAIVRGIIAGVVGLAILYAVLQINKVWLYLR